MSLGGVQLGELAAALLASHPDDVLPDAGHDHILDCALSAFLEYGIRRTTMEEVARRSGISPATLYRRFRTKDEIVRSVFLRDLRRFTAELDKLIDDDSPADEQLTELTIAVARRLEAQRLIARLIDTEPETILPQLTSGAGPLIELGVDYLATVIESWIDAGRIPPVEARPTAEIFIRLFHSLSLTPSTSFPLEDEERLRTFTQTTVRGLLHLGTPSKERS